MYEHRTQPLAPSHKYYLRLARNMTWGAAIIVISLSMGTFGYHLTENLPWIDSLLNASMILTGMGPVNVMNTYIGKLFASFYALFSGVVFLTTIAFVLAPVVHRFFHKFHLADEKKSK